MTILQKLLNNMSKSVKSMLRSRVSKSAIVVVGLLSLQACGDAAIRDLKTFVDTAYQDEKPEIEPLPILEPYKGFEYAAGELPDPFSRGNIMNDESVESLEIEKRDITRRREKLEEYPLDSLAMVGTITKKGVPWVVVQTLDKGAHLATIGNYLGQNEGRIKEIYPEEQKMILVETVPDPSGRLVANEVEMQIDALEE